MRLLDVDFVGGDFNMAAKGTVADMFSDPEFKAPGTTPLWGAGGLEGAMRTARGFHACHADRSRTHGVHTFFNDQLGPRRAGREHTPPGLHAPLGDQSPG